MATRRSDRPTLRHVAERAGVSVATASYVLAGRARERTISDATAERVRAAARDLQYRRNDAARSIRTGKSDLVLLSLHMLADPWSQAVANAVGDYVETLGKTALVLAHGDWRQALARRTPDVVFIDGVTADAVDDLTRLADEGVQIVVFDEHLEPGAFDVVRSGAEPRCHLAVEHLLERHDHVAALARRRRGPRYDAYVTSLATAGLQVREEHLGTYDDDPASAYWAALTLLSTTPRPTAVYCTTDFAAIAVVQAAHRLGLTVPNDVAVVGVGNTPQGERLDPSLSTVGPVGFIEALAKIIGSRASDREGAPGELFDFPWELIVRQSSGGA
ncbi:LacI family DNA-binding transcriptional regulator [Luteipulveratus mongoliensis]|uniref:HTH lacI-type domain-containing protein n=1 Tax=Luteipulveratus mongoliensis TaxID=571913 RepID=A0A0K1JLD6_9MICO|nr:LacI family DNA-binding transcriptional regulator [Luteipulveratus mongoliensis]AKU17539.1 hypothetical protein VV02_19655 [Luteipulveratus mongoliensis]